MRPRVRPFDLEAVRELSENLAANPPVTAIYASHSVPWGKTFRQYLTDGRLIVWVNRGEVAEIPPAISFRDAGALIAMLGIPIYNR